MNVLYIGSSCQRPSARESVHKCCAKTGTSPWYQHLRKIGWDAVWFQEKEKWPCESQRELNQREQFHIDLIRRSQSTPIYNKRRAFMSLQDRKDQHTRYNSSEKGKLRHAKYKKKIAKIQNEAANKDIEGEGQENKSSSLVSAEDQGHHLASAGESDSKRRIHTAILP